MNIQRRTLLRTAAGLVLCGSWSDLVHAESASALVPVVGLSSPLVDIGLGTLRRVFLGDPVDAGGRRLVPFNHPPRTRARVTFDQAVLGLGPDMAAQYWVDQRIRGGARPPRTVASVALLRQVVAQFPGAITYLPVAELDDSVHVLTIGGQGANSPQYPLR